MYSTIISTCLLAAGASAAAIPSPEEGPVVQFRIYDAPGCVQMNEGFFAFQRDEVGGCHNFAEYNTTVDSYLLQTLASGCSGEILPRRLITFTFLLRSVLIAPRVFAVQFWEENNCAGETSSYQSAPEPCSSVPQTSFKITC